MKFPNFQQLDDNLSVVRMADRLSRGYKPHLDECEIARWAIAYSLAVFFFRLGED